MAESNLAAYLLDQYIFTHVVYLNQYSQMLSMSFKKWIIVLQKQISCIEILFTTLLHFICVYF